METQDLISAIDAFLAKNGKGNSYLVKKITSLFESSESPLNLRSGALKNLKKSIETFEKKMSSVDKNLDKFSDKLKQAVSQIKISKLTQLSTASDKFSDSIKAFSKNIKAINLPKSKSGVFPSTTAFARELNNSTNKLKDFRTMSELLLNVMQVFH
jgi:septal ring factor EnvC (AmiA/AmiB activator)